MNKDNHQHDQVTHESASDMDLLHSYKNLAQPVVPVISRSVILMVLSISVYTIPGYRVPDHPGFWRSLISYLQPDYARFEI